MLSLEKHPIRTTLLPALGLVAFLTLPAAELLAATITVNSTLDTRANDGTCSLREAVIAANTNAPSGTAAGECAAGSSGAADTIVLPAGILQLTVTGSESSEDSDALVGDLDVTQS